MSDVALAASPAAASFFRRPAKICGSPSSSDVNLQSTSISEGDRQVDGSSTIRWRCRIIKHARDPLYRRRRFAAEVIWRRSSRRIASPIVSKSSTRHPRRMMRSRLLLNAAADRMGLIPSASAASCAHVRRTPSLLHRSALHRRTPVRRSPFAFRLWAPARRKAIRPSGQPVSRTS